MRLLRRLLLMPAHYLELNILAATLLITALLFRHELFDNTRREVRTKSRSHPRRRINGPGQRRSSEGWEKLGSTNSSLFHLPYGAKIGPRTGPTSW